MQRIAIPQIVPTQPTQPVFRGVAIENPWLLPGYRRNLPHVRFEGATYFVTFRLADSIPEAIAREWQAEREAWLRVRGIEPDWKKTEPARFLSALNALPYSERQARTREQHRKYFIELDRCHGGCLLARTHGVVSRALDYFDAQRVWIGDFVVMPNHVHALVQPFLGVRLEKWLYSVKRFTSREIKSELALDLPESMKCGPVWQPESFDRIVRNRDELAQIRGYIRDNPMKLRPGSFAFRRMPWMDNA